VGESVEFSIKSIGGEVLVGDEFRCYDTHHPVVYRVRTLKNESETITLLCDGVFGYDDQFVGAIIDTTKQGRLGFYYDIG
jgi:hypothetical protein